jgi:CRP-like cAMP-binding protein
MNPYSARGPDLRNAVLVRLEAADSALLSSHLEPVSLARGTSLELRGRRSEYVYFPDRGIASVMMGGGSGVYIGMVGHRSMTALPCIMGADRSPFDTVVQVAGQGHRAPIEAVRDAFNASASLRDRILECSNAFLTQVGMTAAANARHKLPERLAGWLLAAQDYADEQELPFTHDFLARMLGVRRAGVSIALGELESRGVVQRRRGAIGIVNRDGLLLQANGAYTPADEILATVA